MCGRGGGLYEAKKPQTIEVSVGRMIKNLLIGPLMAGIEPTERDPLSLFPLPQSLEPPLCEMLLYGYVYYSWHALLNIWDKRKSLYTLYTVLSEKAF